MPNKGFALLAAGQFETRLQESGSELPTLMSLIEEHARLDFSDFLSTLLAIFHVINEKFPPACLLI